HNYGDALKKLPDGLSAESQASAAGLIQKRDALQKEMLSKDVNAQDVYKPQIDALNGQIKKIIDTNKPLNAEVDEDTGETLANQIKQGNETKTENEIPNTEAQTSVANEGTDKNQPTTEI